ncbi:LysR family transcriptional regulator [Bacillus velezensis]|uniref:LysR family transcriptional regulator n=1 Tax=Bacillus amyloliquefaciens group TaxID=1938374 RepID=UPI0005B62966|nr:MULTISPECIES: LysR family transcriptional regulator [Bacillus amyloliquefaciens group]ATV01614.1 LysR family transcriptional regulator [Bacillus velezensis]AWK46752.1 LysR family transcriptional regulator [Bacillus velezensis]MDF9764073.1 DNA-binding transcriptional LysR family regulator [Bacillus velezensis]MDF9783168.1 DNA-binding transcriptional LysR family regulator [Bacillus velezensis]TJZ70662.1 LysR family transcriptional regulator [Bacillus amyloliquefaciens]
MDLKKHLAFIKTVESGSLTQAAAILNYTQPNISQMISKLEEEYGFPLLIRQRHGVRPTANGLKVLHIMKEIQKNYEKLSQTVDNINGLERGEVRLGTVTSVAVKWLPKILREFNELYPSIKVHLFEGNSTELEEWLKDDRIDAAIGTSHSEKWHFYPLAEDPIVAVMSPQHELAQCETVPLHVMESVKCIVPYPETHFDVLKVLKEEKITPRVAYQIRGDEAIIAMVRNNLGISILPQLLVNDCDVLIKRFDRYVFRQLGILTAHAKETQTPSVQKLIQCIQEWVAVRQASV